MKQAWFKRVGGLPLPVSLPGAVVWLAAILFCINVFLAIDRRSHSASDTLYGVFPFFACTFLLVDWIARSTSDS
jgi:hypothetical protein